MERRHLRRRHLMFHLRVFDAETGAHLGNLANISPNGMMIAGERRLTPGRRYRLQMALPPGVYGTEDFEFGGTVAWVADNLHPAFYDIGFRDLEMSPDERSALEALIDDFEFRDPE